MHNLRGIRRILANEVVKHAIRELIRTLDNMLWSSKATLVGSRRIERWHAAAFLFCCYSFYFDTPCRDVDNRWDAIRLLQRHTYVHASLHQTIRPRKQVQLWQWGDWFDRDTVMVSDLWQASESTCPSNGRSLCREYFCHCPTLLSSKAKTS
jgi:hypothetical protein